MVEGFLEQVHGTLSHRTHSTCHVAVTGDDDDRDVDPPFPQDLLDLKATHSGHSNVEDQAARPFEVVGVQKFTRRRIGLDVEVERGALKAATALLTPGLQTRRQKHRRSECAPARARGLPFEKSARADRASGTKPPRRHPPQVLWSHSVMS